MIASSSGLSSLARSNATTQKPVLSQACWDELRPACFCDLRPFQVAHGRVLHCSVVGEPAPQVGVLILAEDSRGDLLQVQLYNQFPNGALASQMVDMVEARFQHGTKLSIAEPFLKIMKDGFRGVRVDSPADLRVETVCRSLSSLKEQGNQLAGQHQFDVAQQEYMAALALPEVDEVATLLANRAQAFLQDMPIQACLDAAAVLILRPTHEKAWMRYASGLKEAARREPRLSKELLAMSQRVATVTGSSPSITLTVQDTRGVLGYLLGGVVEGGGTFRVLERFTSEFGGSSQDFKQQANQYYKQGKKAQASGGYTLALHRTACSEQVAALLSNLSHVSLRMRESHNAIAFASAALRVLSRNTSLSKKSFFRLGRGLHQLGEGALLSDLLQVMDGRSPEEEEKLRKLMGAGRYRARLYTNGEARVFLEGTTPAYADAFPEVVMGGLEVVLLEGRGRGVVARRRFLHCDLVVVGHALSSAVNKDEKVFVSVVSGSFDSDASRTRVSGMLTHAASRNNEVSWTLSQLCSEPGQRKPTVQLQELFGLSCRWLPLLGQRQCYYPPQERGMLAASIVASTLQINSHGTGGTGTGVFPLAALFNHSHEPNCTYVPLIVDGNIIPDMLAVVTLREVAEGEELTVSYADPMPERNAWGI